MEVQSSASTIARTWFLIGLAWAAAFSLAPFEFAWPPGGFWAGALKAFRPDPAWSALVAAAHWLGFAFLGYAWGLEKSRWGWKDWLWALATGLALCLVLELLKLFVPGRHAIGADAAIKWCGWCAGLFLASRRPGNRQLFDGVKWARGTLLVVAAGGAAAWYFQCLRPVTGALALAWDDNMPLVIGNELDGQRPWLGTIERVTIYDRAAPLRGDERILAELGQPDGVRNFEASGDVTKSSPAGFRFFGGKLVSAAAGRAISEAVAESGQFAVEAVINPRDLNQRGPARIATVSRNWAFRNFTLGQEDDRLVLRVRNAMNGPNGARYELSQPGLVRGWNRVVASYDHGYSAMWVDGRRLPKTTDLRLPVFYFPVAKDRIGLFALFALLVTTVILPLSVFVGRWWLPAMIGGVIVCMVPLLICQVAGGPRDPGPLTGLLATAAVVGLPAHWLVASASRRRGCVHG